MRLRDCCPVSRFQRSSSRRSLDKLGQCHAAEGADEGNDGWDDRLHNEQWCTMWAPGFSGFRRIGAVSSTVSQASWSSLYVSSGLIS